MRINYGDVMEVWVLYMILKEDQGKFGVGEIVWNIPVFCLEKL